MERASQWNAGSGSLDFLRLSVEFSAAIYDGATFGYRSFYGCALPRRMEAVSALVGLCTAAGTPGSMQVSVEGGFFSSF